MRKGKTAYSHPEGRLEVGTRKPGKVESSLRAAPPPQRVRVAGRLDSICYGDRMFTLVLDGGEVLRGLVEVGDATRLAKLFGQQVLVSGTALFRPSGSVLWVETDRIEAATGDVSLWSRMPHSILGDLDRRSLRRPQGPRSGLNAIFGHWPGDESEEEIAAALAELS
ncbi:MAG TPA: hypothetical protein VFE33_03855 [Thermoanaerobaculia bacterium]|nr:hypothetical protein [Thermoanaerobaculia bacterium]